MVDCGVDIPVGGYWRLSSRQFLPGKFERKSGRHGNTGQESPAHPQARKAGATTFGHREPCGGLFHRRRKKPMNRAKSSLIGVNPLPSLTTPEPRDARRSNRTLGGKSDFFGSAFIRTTIRENLRSRRKFLAPRVSILHPQSSTLLNVAGCCTLCCGNVAP